MILDTFLDIVKMKCQEQHINYCRAVEYIAIEMYNNHNYIPDDVIKIIKVNHILNNFTL